MDSRIWGRWEREEGDNISMGDRLGEEDLDGAIEVMSIRESGSNEGGMV
jgi:hypothetical protein